MARHPDRTPVRPHSAGAATEPRSRAQILRRAAWAGGVALAGVTATGAPRLVGAAQSPARDRQALNLLLLVEYAEVGLYTAALRGGALDGDLRSYAQTVLGHERAHLSALKQALGGAAVREPEHDFGPVTRDGEKFADAAGRLEDIAVGAYNGQAANVSREAFAAAARIVSVEARHAAWIRSIVDRDPAPDAVDTPRTEAQVRRGLKSLGVRL